MKHIIILLVFQTLFVCKVNCQSITIDVGTKWIYRATSLSSQKYLTYEIKKDTIIDNNNLWILEKGEVEYIGIPGNLVQQDYKYLESYYLRLQNNNLDMYHEGDFVHLFPLFPEINQQWEIKSIKENPCENNISMTDMISVLSMENITVDGQIVEKVTIADNGNWGYSDTFYSGIGPANDFFSVPSFLCQGFDITQGYGEQIVCISDNTNSVEFINTNEDICSLLLSNESILTKNEAKQVPLDIYPNPSRGVLFVKANLHYYEIIRLNGTIVKTQSISDNNFINSIDTSDLETGIYIIRGLTKDNKLLTNKIMLHNEN